MIHMTKINKSFQDLHVLNDVDFHGKKGATTAIIGPSGSGKSTLLRCINLLERPDSGTLQVGDATLEFGKHKRHSSGEIAAIRRQTGMVFQAFYLFPHKTILENIIEAPVHVLKENPKEAKETALALLEKVGLSDKWDSYLGTLSGGQQQRAAIARALSINPSVLLLDEPTSALDPELEREVLKVIQDLVAEKRTMLLVTHNLRFAREVSDYIAFMEAGRVEAFGTSEEIFSDRAAPRVQEFINAMIAT